VVVKSKNIFKFNNMRKIITLSVLAFAFLLGNCSAGSPEGKAKSGEVIVLTNETFKQKVFNYEVNKQWKYEGTMPAIIDFYATWCGPCRQISPRIEEIAREYAGKIVVYKVDVDVERQLAQNLGIQSLPTILFIPAKGQPQAAMGALPKESLVKAINEVLLVK